MRRYKHLIALLSVSVGVVTGLSACGGDSSGEVPIVVTGTEPTTLTKAEFITQADALCDTANSAISDIADAGEGITRAADVANLRQGLITDIEALGTPVDDGSSSTSTAGTTTPEVSTFPGDSSENSSDTTTSATGATTDSTGATSTSATPSTGDDLQDFLTALGDEVKAGEKIDLANQRGEDTSAGEGELTAAKDRAATAGEAYGFTICGTDGTTSQDTSTPTIGTDSSSGTSDVPSTVTPSAPSTDSSGGSSSTPPADDGSSDGGTSGGVGTGGGVGPG